MKKNIGVSRGGHDHMSGNRAPGCGDVIAAHGSAQIVYDGGAAEGDYGLALLDAFAGADGKGLAFRDRTCGSQDGVVGITAFGDAHDAAFHGGRFTGEAGDIADGEVIQHDPDPDVVGIEGVVIFTQVGGRHMPVGDEVFGRAALLPHGKAGADGGGCGCVVGGKADDKKLHNALFRLTDDGGKIGLGAGGDRQHGGQTDQHHYRGGQSFTYIFHNCSLLFIPSRGNPGRLNTTCSAKKVYHPLEILSIPYFRTCGNFASLPWMISV